MKMHKGLGTIIFLLFAYHSSSNIIFTNDSLKQDLIINEKTLDAPIIFDTLFVTWTGLISTEWSNANNWSGNAVLTENADIIIPAGTSFSPVIPNGASIICNSIKVRSGAAITFAPGSFLKIKSGTNPSGTPSQITSEATLITNVSAQLGGTITSIGGCAISQYGIAISTYNNPTINHIIYPDISLNGVGTFSIPVGPLLPATTYFVRTFATNCKGTSYGNEISFTTLGGGSGADTGYFRLITGGVIYFSYDLQDPKVTTVFPEGDTRIAFVTRDASQNTFSVAAQSSFVLNPTKSFGFSFGYINPDVNGTGTYSFAKAPASGEKAIEIAIRSGPGASDAFTPNYNTYANSGNYTRRFVEEECVFSEIVSQTNTLIITRWGNAGEFIEGTITGTLYEAAKTSLNCTNSVAKPFLVEFKLKRLQ